MSQYAGSCFHRLKARSQWTSSRSRCDACIKRSVTDSCCRMIFEPDARTDADVETAANAEQDEPEAVDACGCAPHATISLTPSVDGTPGSDARADTQATGVDHVVPPV